MRLRRTLVAVTATATLVLAGATPVAAEVPVEDRPAGLRCRAYERLGERPWGPIRGYVVWNIDVPRVEYWDAGELTSGLIWSRDNRDGILVLRRFCVDRRS